MNSSTRPTFGRTVLLLAAVGTLCVAAVQAIMPFSDYLVRAFDGPQDWSRPMLFASSFAVAGILVLIALYPFSGAGVVRRLPLLRTVLAVVGVGFLYRGLPLPFQVADALGFGSSAGDITWSDIVSSAGTLFLGCSYLLGLVLSWPMRAEVRPSRQRTAE